MFRRLSFVTASAASQDGPEATGPSSPPAPAAIRAVIPRSVRLVMDDCWSQSPPGADWRFPSPVLGEEASSDCVRGQALSEATGTRPWARSAGLFCWLCSLSSPSGRLRRAGRTTAGSAITLSDSRNWGINGFGAVLGASEPSPRRYRCRRTLGNRRRASALPSPSIQLGHRQVRDVLAVEGCCLR